jgi:hypothetical protein
MRIMARQAGVMDGLYNCTECGEPMVKVGTEFRCTKKVEPEELVAVGFIPGKDAKGSFTFVSSARDQQKLQASQASSNSVEIDNAFLEKLGLDLDKIRQYQIKHNIVP